MQELRMAPEPGIPAYPVIAPPPPKPVNQSTQFITTIVFTLLFFGLVFIVVRKILKSIN